MAIREIIILPDKQLRLVSRPVEKVTAQVRKLADDMFETMYAAPGIGLAAIQVAEPLRLITMDLAKRDENGQSTPRPRVFVNPEIVSSSEEKSTYEEGCLSIPEYYEEVERPAKVRVRFTDLDGKTHEEDADGLYATCIQHEIDHLNGVLFVDYLSKLKRDRVLKKFEKAAKRAAEEGLPPRRSAVTLRGEGAFGPEPRRRRQARSTMFPAPSFEARKGSHPRMTLAIVVLG